VHANAGRVSETLRITTRVPVSDQPPASRNLLFEIPPRDTVSFLPAGAIAATCATLVPLRRTPMADPGAVLRGGLSTPQGGAPSAVCDERWDDAAAAIIALQKTRAGGNPYARSAVELFQ